MKKLVIGLAIVALLFAFFDITRIDAPGSAAPAATVSLFEAVTSAIVLISILVLSACLVLLWFQIDKEALRQEGGYSGLMRSMRWTLPVPPERLLTSSGMRTARIGKVAILIFAATLALMITRSLISS